MTLRDIYSQPDAPDPVLEDDFVVELVRRHAPQSASGFNVDETGGEARAYVFDEVVLKTQRPQQLRPRTSLEKESFILEQLAAVDSIVVPRILGYGREGDVEYEVLSRMPGIALRDTTLSPNTRAAVLRNVGAALRAIHEIDQSALKSSGLVPGDQSSRDVAVRLSTYFDDAVEVIAQGGGAWDDVRFAELRREFLTDLPSDQPLVTLHSNPGPEHCFVDPNLEKLSGLIDFGDAFQSHPALDVRSWYSFEDSRLLLDGYALAGRLSPDFLSVWQAGVLVSEVRLAARAATNSPTLQWVIEQLRNERRNAHR